MSGSNYEDLDVYRDFINQLDMDDIKGKRSGFDPNPREGESSPYLPALDNPNMNIPPPPPATHNCREKYQMFRNYHNPGSPEHTEAREFFGECMHCKLEVLGNIKNFLTDFNQLD